MFGILMLAVLVACGAPNPPTILTTPGSTPSPRSTSTPAPAPKTVHRTATDVAALLDGKAVTLAEIDRRLPFGFKDELAEMAEVESAYRLAEERLRQLDDLIDERLLVAVAPRAGIEVPEENIDNAIAELRRVNNLSEDDFDNLITTNGYTMAEYRLTLRQQMIANAVVTLEMKPGESKDAARRRVVERYRAQSRIAIVLVLPPKPKLAAPRNVSTLLTADDLAATFKRPMPTYTGDQLIEGPAGYDTWHLKATDKPEAFDVAIRVWRASAGDIDRKWQDLKSSLNNTVKDDKIGTESLTAREDSIFGHGFLDRPRSVVVLISCGNELCKSAAETFAITKLVHSRLDRLAK